MFSSASSTSSSYNINSTTSITTSNNSSNATSTLLGVATNTVYNTALNNTHTTTSTADITSSIFDSSSKRRFHNNSTTNHHSLDKNYVGLTSSTTSSYSGSNNGHQGNSRRSILVSNNSFPDHGGNVSSDDNRSPLPPSCMRRSYTSDEQSLSRSRQQLYPPSDASMPNTPSLSPNIRSPSILKRVASNPKISPHSASESKSTDQQQFHLSVNHRQHSTETPKPHKSIIKKRTTTYGGDNAVYPEGEMLRSSPDGCSRAHSSSTSFKATSDSRAVTGSNISSGGDFSCHANHKYSLTNTNCSNCISSYEKKTPESFTAHCHTSYYPNEGQNNPNLMASIETAFSPMLKSCKELLSDQRNHRRTLSEEANKTLEAVENDLRELCNLPRTNYRSETSKENLLRKNIDDTAYFQGETSKSRFSRQHGSFKRHAEKSSNKPNFDRTRSAVDLTKKDQEDPFNMTSYAQHKTLSTGKLNNQQENPLLFQNQDMQPINRSISAKSLLLETTNGESYGISPGLGYCSSSLPKRKISRNFRDSIEDTAVELSSRTHSNDQLNNTLNNGQVIQHYGREGLPSHQLKQSNLSKNYHYSSLPYSSSSNHRKSMESKWVDSGRSSNTYSNNRNENNAGLNNKYEQNYEQDVNYHPRHYSVTKNCAYNDSSPTLNPCSHSLQYYQERAPRNYQAEERRQMMANVGRSTSLRYGNQQKVPSAANQQPCSSNICTSNQYNKSNSSPQYCYGCNDKKCSTTACSRSLSATPLEEQKDFQIPNYFCNNSKGSHIPASLLPRYQQWKSEQQQSHQSYNTTVDETYGFRDSFIMRNEKATNCYTSCSSHSYSQEDPHHLKFRAAGCFNSCQVSGGNHHSHTGSSSNMHSKLSKESSACCATDTSRPCSFTAAYNRGEFSGGFASQAVKPYNCHGSSAQSQKQQQMLHQSYKQQSFNQESDEGDPSSPVWSWEQRIADVESSVTQSHRNWVSSAEVPNNMPQLQKQQQNIAANYNKHDTHARHCEHFQGTSTDVRSQDYPSRQDIVSGKQQLQRRRSFSKELAEFAFGSGGQASRRTISCLPTNLVRNALSNNDPSYKLLKQDPDDDQSEAGTSNADMTPYRYA